MNDHTATTHHADLRTAAPHTALAGRARRFVVAMVVALTAFLALPATEASAYSASNGGVPGTVTPYTVYGQMVTKASNGYYSTLPGVWVPGPFVTRSPYSAGRQIVKYNILIEQYWPSTNSWLTRVHDPVYVPTAYLEYANSTVKFNDRYEQLGSGTYRVSYVIRWFNSSGAVVGIKHIQFNHYGDYGCRTGSALSCQTGTGWVRL